MRNIMNEASAGRKIVRQLTRLDLGCLETTQLLELFNRETKHNSTAGAVSEACYVAYLAGLAVGMRNRKNASA